MTDLLTQKNTKGVNFPPRKNMSDPLILYTESTLLGVFQEYLKEKENYKTRIKDSESLKFIKYKTAMDTVLQNVFLKLVLTMNNKTVIKFSLS